MRHLASIQVVHNVEPIEGADRIELVQVLGWQCVANKGDFKKGDHCIYFEIDSFLPIKPEFEFLRKSSYKNNEFMGEGFKIKTIKLRGQISQGLVMPVPESMKDLEVGEDVTEQLGVKKWELPEEGGNGGETVGDRPEFISKSDEVRIQSKPRLLDDFAGLPYYITTKCDGSSHSIGINEFGDFYMSSRRFTIKDDPEKSPFVRLVRKNNFEEKLREYMALHNLNSIVVQGELCSPKIQKNRLKLIEAHWYIFTVDENRKRVGLEEMKKVIDFIGGEMVMIDEVGVDLPSKYPDIDALLKKADGKYPNGTNREGIVIRPCEPVYNRGLQSYLSMKVVSNKYLLKNED